MTSSLLGHQYLLVTGRDKKCPSLFACLCAVHPCLSWKPMSRIGDCFGGHRTREPHPSITSLCPPLCQALCHTHPRAQRTSYREHEYNLGATTSIWEPYQFTSIRYLCLLKLHAAILTDGGPYRVDKYKWAFIFSATNSCSGASWVTILAHAANLHPH